MLKKCRAFTLTELMIAVVLLGVVAAFGMPSYEKAREKAFEREALANLMVMGDAYRSYLFRNNNSVPSDAPQVNDINTLFNLGIVEEGVDYSCVTSIALGKFVCEAASPVGWVVQGVPDSGLKCKDGTGEDCPSQAQNTFYPGLEY